uniref:Ribosome maturation protein SDO1/SBDS N-terminal domain-containing protein n=1 Tax=Bartheletia paradoxa TaxID=669517 RepID=A0A2D0XHW9_9BASI|nr:hypothetical protein SPAR03153 [Bartheletia paradoxa]
MGMIQKPSNQIKLTNVSIVRYKKAGKRFEIACYKNKVGEWRTGVETDIDEVVQISNVFSNVSKGAVSPATELEKAFKTTDRDQIILEILKKGELQVGEKERSSQIDSLWREIATQISEKTVDPSTQRPHSVSMIEKAMLEAHFSVNTTMSAKRQALDCIKLLQAQTGGLPIERSRMRVRVTMPSKDGKRLQEKLKEMASMVEDEDWGDEYEGILLIDPGQYRILTSLLETECKGRGKVETLSFAAVEGEERLE